MDSGPVEISIGGVMVGAALVLLGEATVAAVGFLLVGAFMMNRGWRVYRQEGMARFEQAFTDGFSPALETLADGMSRMYPVAAPGRSWERDFQDLPFPSLTNLEPRARDFAERVYPSGEAHSPRAMFDQSLASLSGMSVEEFEGFHAARRSLTRFLQTWAVRTASQGHLRRYTERRLSRPSTRRAVTAVIYLEVAQGRALRNVSALIAGSEWYEWMRQMHEGRPTWLSRLRLRVARALLPPAYQVRRLPSAPERPLEDLSDPEDGLVEGHAGEQEREDEDGQEEGRDL